MESGAVGFVEIDLRQGEPADVGGVGAHCWYAVCLAGVGEVSSRTGTCDSGLGSGRHGVD